MPRLGKFPQSSQISANDDSKKDSSDSSADSNSQPDGAGSDSETESDSGSDRSSHASEIVDANTLKPKKAWDINTFQREEDFTPMTDEQCLLANPFVKGMDVKSKEWSDHPPPIAGFEMVSTQLLELPPSALEFGSNFSLVLFVKRGK